MQTQRTVDGAPRHVARFDARQVAGGAAALGASSDRASRQRPPRHGASAQGRRRGAHRRLPQGPPAEHHRRHRQGIERRPRHDRRRAVAHRQGQRRHRRRGGRVAMAHTLSRGVPQRASRPQREEAPDPGPSRRFASREWRTAGDRDVSKCPTLTVARVGVTPARRVIEPGRVSRRPRSEDSVLAGGDAPPLWPDRRSTPMS